ncbi:MAG: M48 family metalloprotease [Betaproteobacteria bacterium]|uniref:M48 family metalloprotease n=1 Tax=Candidatus Proximibacter danicus TaxID=2954365 RepID=A0A9D7PS29_9PROT|nr:M48 family metalloprotease [Candidatus Proximibacter danicus]
MAVALLAVCSNSQAAGAAMAGSEAAMGQSQLAFTRDFEREADRVGFDILQKAGYDPRGMPEFSSACNAQLRLLRTMRRSICVRTRSRSNVSATCR